MTFLEKKENNENYGQKTCMLPCHWNYIKRKALCEKMAFRNGKLFVSNLLFYVKTVTQFQNDRTFIIISHDCNTAVVKELCKKSLGGGVRVNDGKKACENHLQGTEVCFQLMSDQNGVSTDEAQQGLLHHCERSVGPLHIFLTDAWKPAQLKCQKLSMERWSR